LTRWKIVLRERGRFKLGPVELPTPVIPTPEVLGSNSEKQSYPPPPHVPRFGYEGGYIPRSDFVGFFVKQVGRVEVAPLAGAEIEH